ncbi:MAG: hypothetical protein ABFC38_05625 [Methanospirillum sp.]
MLSEIIADEIDVVGSLFMVAIGFGAGIIGGIVGFQYQRRHDRMAASAEARRHFRARLTGRLDEIVAFWNAGGESELAFEPVRKKFEMFGRRISKDLSDLPVPLRPEIRTEFEGLIAALNRVRDLDRTARDIGHLEDEGEAAVEKAERIRALKVEWFATE